MEVRKAVAIVAEIVIVPEVLRSKLGDEGARELVTLINKAANGIRENVSETGMGIKRLESGLAETKADLEKQAVETKADLSKRIVETKADLEKQIANTRADVIKWMFIFWAGQIAAMTGLLSLFYKLLK
jgi:hypothetical protein